MNAQHTPRPWRAGKAHGAVVADSPVYPDGREDERDKEYYGGNLVAESIQPHNRGIIIAAPELLDALEEAVHNVSRTIASGAPANAAVIDWLGRATLAILVARGGIAHPASDLSARVCPDARLNQAAPSLLAALEKLVEWVGLRDGTEEDNLRPLEEQFPEVQQAMRALKEARGLAS